MYQTDRKVGIFSVPVERGQKKPGPACTTGLINRKELMENIEDNGLKAHDYGSIELFNLDDDPNIYNALYPRTFYINTLNIAKKYSEIMNEDNTIITIGGDHSLSAGTILGHSQVHNNISVIWVDAHADINTPLSSGTGNIHGMPLSFLVHEMQNEMPWIPELEDLYPVISAQHLAYIGLRSVDPYERHVIEKYNIKAFSMEDVDNMGIHCVIQEAIKAVNPNLDRYFHLSFDVDGLDPLYAPSTGTKVPGGLTLREGIYICEQMYNTGKLVAVDIAEINPQISSFTEAKITINSGKKLIYGSLGIRRQGLASIDPNYYEWKTANSSRYEIFNPEH